MTEAEWLACEDPQPMLHALTHRPQQSARGRSTNPLYPSDRKCRLFAVACCRRVWHLLADGRGRDAVLVAERYADGEATARELDDARDDAWEAAADTMPGDVREALLIAACTTTGVGGATAARSATQAPTDGLASLLRDVVGNPWQPVRLPFRCRGCGIPCGPPAAGHYCVQCGADESFCPLLTPAALSLARAAYEGRADDGALDPVRLAVLADCLEEAGCDEPILWHLRGEYEAAPEGWYPYGGPHVRGCWAVDLVLGEE